MRKISAKCALNFATKLLLSLVDISVLLIVSAGEQGRKGASVPLTYDPFHIL